MAILPKATLVCTELGRLTRNTLPDAAAAGSRGQVCLDSLFFQVASRCSNLAINSLARTSPAMPRMAFCGPYLSRCHLTSASRLIASMDSRVIDTCAAGCSPKTALLKRSFSRKFAAERFNNAVFGEHPAAHVSMTRDAHQKLR